MNYGYFEIRMKCPGAPGNWSAFFMYPADDYYKRPQAKYTSWEMDFLEILGSNINKLNVTTHQKDNQNATNSNNGSVVDTGPNDDDFHVFGFDKQPGKVDVYRDGKLILTKKTESRMTTAGYLCLVLDVGKNRGWAGTPNPAQYPQTLLVDYVRFYRTPATTIVGGPFSSVQMGDVHTTSGP
jgi:beta-glucanase (GH16 family)